MNIRQALIAAALALGACHSDAGDSWIPDAHIPGAWWTGPVTFKQEVEWAQADQARAREKAQRGMIACATYSATPERCADDASDPPVRPAIHFPACWPVCWGNETDYWVGLTARSQKHQEAINGWIGHSSDPKPLAVETVSSTRVHLTQEQVKQALTEYAQRNGNVPLGSPDLDCDKELTSKGTFGVRCSLYWRTK